MHDYEIAAASLLKRLAANGQALPVVGVICGSGLSGLAKCIDASKALTVHYQDIPGFPRATVAGHKGELVFGPIGGIDVVCMLGRFHFYEGNDMNTVSLPVRVMRLLGVKMLIVTNAAGGLNPAFSVGDIAIIQDHFGMPLLAGNTPLRGLNNDTLGPRFPAVSDAYDEKLQDMLLACSDKLQLRSYLRPNALYCFVAGPSYESRAECRFLRSIGGDTVGMSTIPEVVAAKHAGMKVLCLSLVTNQVVVEKGEGVVHASHAEVLQAVETSGKRIQSLLTAYITKENLGQYLDALPSVVYKPAPRGLLEQVFEALQSAELRYAASLAVAVGVGYSLSASRSRA